MMRVLLAIVPLLVLAGCVELPIEEVDDEPRPMHLQPPRGIHMPPPVANLAQGASIVDGRIIIEEVSSFHGTYRLVLDDAGVWCETEAGPDQGAIGIVNTCSIGNDEVFVQQQTTTHDSEMLLVESLPRAFEWQLRVELEYQEGNTTVMRYHDGIHRTLELSPAMETTLQLDLGAACDWPDELESSTPGPRHRLAAFTIESAYGWPYVELPLRHARIADVETNGDWRFEDGLLRIDGQLGVPLEGIIWLDPEAGPTVPQGPNPCSPVGALGFYAEPIELRRGATGLVDTWVEQQTTPGVLPVWLVV